MSRPMSRLLILLVAGLLALPARAGLFDDTEARGRIDKLRADFDALSQRVDTATKNQVDFANQVEAIQADIAKLRGQLEVITNDLDTTQKRQKDFYVDLDTRLRKLESQADSAAKPEEAKPVDPANETRDYEAALTALKSLKYSDAASGFAAFIKNYPNSTLMANANFWAGYSHAQIKQYARAADYYAAFAAMAPTDARAPDALLEQANSLESAGAAKEARKVLQSLVQKYPASDAAKKAKPRLKKR